METVRAESIIVKRDSTGVILTIVAYNPEKRTREPYKVVPLDDDDWIELLKNTKENGTGTI